METNPIRRFREVYERAEKSGIELPEAAALATVGEDSRPSIRMVLLKSFDENGFVFYTNLESRKAEEIAANPYVTLLWWWPPLQEQVRVEGPVRQVSDAEADAYFATRDRESQIGAWASRQSSELGSRDDLLRAFEATKREFENREVTRPPRWSGYRLAPRLIEFWLGRPHRLHERFLYTRDGDDWVVKMLYP